MTAHALELIKVVGLGQASVDYYGRLFDFPSENSKAELSDLHMSCGGPAATALVTLSRLGIPCSFLGSISDDIFGEEIAKNFEQERVDSSQLKITAGQTSQFAFIAISEDSGNRTIFWHRGNAPELITEDIDIRRFSNAKVLHLDGLMLYASMEAARQARDLGMTIVMDGGTLREGALKLASMVDILIVSETFARALLASNAPIEDALHSLKELGPSQVGVTLGQNGSIGLDDSGIIYQEAFPVKVVDTTGAGDVYHGAYIYGVLQGWEMGVCMQFASAAAALKCSALGAQPRQPLELARINDLVKKAN